MRSSFLVAVAMVCAPTLAFARSSQTYTSLCSTPQSGDVAGWKISVMPHRREYRVSFNYSDGQLMKLVITDRVVYDLATGHLKFQVRRPGGLVKFDGIAGKADLVGRLSDSAIGTDETVTLKSVPSDWDPPQFPNCPKGS